MLAAALGILAAVLAARSASLRKCVHVPAIVR